MSWTSDVRLFLGYDENDPRPPGAARARPGATGRVRVRPSRRSSSASARRRPTGWSASRRPIPKAWFDAFPDAADATPLLAAARAIKTRAGGRADAARERDRRRRDGARPGASAARHARERGRRDVERLGARPRDGLRGEGRARARLLARLVGAGDPNVHGDGQPADRRARADALRDLGLRRRLLVRPHEEPRAGRARAALRRARGQ